MAQLLDELSKLQHISKIDLLTEEQADRYDEIIAILKSNGYSVPE